MERERVREREYQTSRQGFLKYFMNPTFTDAS